MTSTEARALAPADLDELRRGFRGELLLPEDPAYEGQRRIWNRLIRRHPSLIARVADAEDTRRTLAFGRQRGLPISVRGGGHNVSGSALADDGVVIDQTLRRGITVDPATRRAEVEPGVLLGELDQATAPHGLAVPIGINTTTGVAGLTLGGGIGWLMRRDGLTIDHLVAADLLTVDGDLLHVDDAHDAELFWAIRGGGGNFGIVTRFEFEAVPLGPSVLAGQVFFAMDEGESVLGHYRDWVAELPDAVTTIVALRTTLPLPVLPTEMHGRRVVGIGVCHAGPQGDDSRILERVTGFGTPLFSTLARKPFVTHQASFDATVPAGIDYYWKSHFLSGLPDEAIDTLVEQHRRAPQPWSYSLLGQLRGAIARVAADATAYPNRLAPFSININGAADDPAQEEAIVSWTRGCFEALVPFSTGGVYVNFVGNEGEERVRAAYGPAYARLAELKARYDPTNVLRTNQNIRPATA
jgi:FAD/FMN-containing dehydrogenase